MTTIASIMEAARAHYGLGPCEIASKHRDRRIARPRQVVMYLARQLTKRSFAEIGRALRRDHTTVMHGSATIERLLSRDQALAADVAAIRDRLAGRASERMHAEEQAIMLAQARGEFMPAAQRRWMPGG